jgi:EpsI family protein
MFHYLKDRYFLVASALLLAQIGAYYSISIKENMPAISPWSQFPTEIAGWQTVTESPMEAESLASLQPDDYLDRNYVSKKRQGIVNLVVVYFRTRRSGRAPHSPQWCLPGAGWKAVSSRVVNLPQRGESGLQAINEYIVQKGAERLLVVFWYHQGSHVVTNDVVAQMYALPEMILHGRTDTALVRIIVPFANDQSDPARDAAFEFVHDAFPLIRNQIN